MHEKNCFLSGTTVTGYKTSITLHEAMDDCRTHTGSFAALFAGEIRIEYPLPDIGPNSLTGIHYSEKALPSCGERAQRKP
jgi:hypothetical protein